MKEFHDLQIYAGTEVATTGSRLELAAKNTFLREIFSELNYCEGCREPVVVIFPDEDVNTLREAFDTLSHFKSGLSIIQSKYCSNLKRVLNPYKYNFRSSEGQLPVGSVEFKADQGRQRSLQQED